MPLRSISQELGYKVDWAGEASQIHISKSGKSITVDLKNYKITSANNHSYYMSDGDYAKFIDNKAYIGKSFFEDNFDLKVTTDTLNNKVRIECVLQNQITLNNINQHQQKTF